MDKHLLKPLVLIVSVCRLLIYANILLQLCAAYYKHFNMKKGKWLVIFLRELNLEERQAYTK